MVFFITMVFIACKSRKVATEISKSADKTKTEEISEVKTKIEETIKDQTKTINTESDTSKKVEHETTSVTADSIIYNKNTGEYHFKGHAKLNTNKTTNTSTNINKSLQVFNDILAKNLKTIDSLGKRKENKNVTEFKKSKQSESKSYGEFIIPGIILILIAIIAIKWDSIKKMFSISTNRKF